MISNQNSVVAGIADPGKVIASVADRGIFRKPVCRYQRTRRNLGFSICDCGLEIMFF